ncbi:MAG: helix-turn-helix transcriptional regulator [Eubacteriales bacterium]|nr:helix-turn-helix transcriptional regulator [Eubacteriales bacterium]
MKMNEVIRAKRREQKMTQEQVAEYLGVTAPAVHKWEKGSAYPDITLVPALARLLQIDLETLFCFREELTEKEIVNFQNEMADTVKERGLEAGCSFAEEKLREYPNCGLLFHGAALILQGSLMMADMPENEKKNYKRKLINWYERAMEHGDEKLRNRAGSMAVAMYLGEGQAEKAQAILDCLPEPQSVRKYVQQADIYAEQGKNDEAARLLSRELTQLSTEVLGILDRMVGLELSLRNVEKAQEIAEKLEETANALDQGGYIGMIGKLQVAVKTKNVQASLNLLEKMLSSVFVPWNRWESVLYYRMILNEEFKEKQRNVQKESQLVILPPLLAELENNSDYDFLRGNDEFQRMLEKYRRRSSQNSQGD